MNIKAQRILNRHLNNVEIGDANRHIINAMKEFASNYHKEQLQRIGIRLVAKLKHKIK